MKHWASICSQVRHLRWLVSLLLALPVMADQVLLDAGADISGGQSTSYTVTSPGSGGLWISVQTTGDVTVSPANSMDVTANQQVTFNVNGGDQGGSYSLLVTLGDYTQPPEITSAPSAYGAPGYFFTYQIRATKNPYTFSAQNLPAGLSLDSSSGVISGYPAATGVTEIALTATNAAGTSETFVFWLNVVTPTPQSISFTVANQTLAAPRFLLEGTASSGLPVSYSILFGPVTISGSVVTASGTGIARVRASQAGGVFNGMFYEAATSIERDVNISKATQTITFPNPGNGFDFGDVIALTATASSALPVSYALVSGPGTLADGMLLINGAGTVSVRATQAGDATFSAAAGVTISFTVGNGSSTPDTLIGTTTFSTVGSVAYTVPSGTDYVVITASGGGGGASRYTKDYSFSTNGGRGASVSATYAANSGELFNVSVGGGGAASNYNWAWQVPWAWPPGTTGGWPNGGGGSKGGGAGGGSSSVVTPRGTVWAAGGGGAGWNADGSQAAHHGGDGGTPIGFAGANRSLDGWSGNGGTSTMGGAGGTGPSYQEYVRTGYSGGSGTYFYGSNGGGGGGGGFYGGGSGGASACMLTIYNNGQPSYGMQPNGAGGGGGGASAATGAAIKTIYQIANNAGGVVAGTAQPGSSGSVSISAYRYNSPALPTITSPLAVCGRTQQAIEYWIAATRRPTTYSASGLPPGLSLDSATGRVFGTPTNVGVYNSAITATNVTGTTQATLVWKVDDTPPSQPVAANFQTQDIGLTSFIMIWPASSDNLSGVVAYEVQRDDVSLGTTSATQLVVGGLASGVTCQMKVRALDAAGNWSDWSVAKAVQTLADGSAPSAPTALVVTNVTASAIGLKWSPSADNVGVATYEVIRDDTISAGTVAGTSLTVSGLNAATPYRFRVKARDAANNISNLSGELSVTTAVAGADTLLATTLFSINDRTPQSYIVPATANYVVIKTWGAGGGGWKNSATTSPGGNADFASASFNVTPGEKLTVLVGTGGAGWTIPSSTAGATGSGLGGWPAGASGGNEGGGGGYSKVSLLTGSIWAKGGSGSGGAAGGASGGANATGPAYNVIVSSGANNTAGISDPHYVGNRVGVGGFVFNGADERNGGSGEVAILAYKTPNTDLTMTFYPTGSVQSFTLPPGADSVTVKAWGGGQGGANNFAGEGGRYASGTYTVAGGQAIVVNPGNGGASGVAGSASVATLPGGITLTAAGGATLGNATPQSISDLNYPGNGTAYGGTAAGGPGSNGAIVLVVHIAPPAITSAGTFAALQNQTINYSITASNSPTLFAASGLPEGLTLNSATGAISGKVLAPGTYTSSVTAKNRGGISTPVTLTFTIGADVTAPSWTGAVGLQATNITHQSFTMSWNAATDNVGVTAYEIKRGELIKTVVTLGESFGGLLPLTTYAMSVRARDAAGNWSNWSAPVNVSTNGIPTAQPFSTAFLPGGATTYTVSSDTSYVIVKAWGAGGAGSTVADGGAGAFVSATYSVAPGQVLGVAPGISAADMGGTATIVTLPGGTVIYAAGGGSAGKASGGQGGAGGATDGTAGGGSMYGQVTGGQGGVTTSEGTGVGGEGGYGNATMYVETGQYDEDGNPISEIVRVGSGATGGFDGAADGGDRGPGGTDDALGGRGGGGKGGGGGGGSGFIGGGGGGGGSSAVVPGSQTPSSILFLAGSNATPPNTSDPNYPGNNVAAGGSGNNPGGSGAVVIIAYPGTPAFTSALTQSVVQYQPINYTITTVPAAQSFAASNLPTGLALIPSSGLISGSIAATGNYSSTISATNTIGTTSATLVWNVSADTTAPSTPTGLTASGLTTNSFLLTWSAATDNAAVKDYEVMRDSVSLGLVPGTALTVNGLAAAATYQMKVRARDNVGNLSGWSTVLNVTLSTSGATQAPYASYAERSTTDITLVWNPQAGAIGGYQVYRDGTLKGTTTDLLLFDAGLSAGQSYTYVIRGLDAAGNPTGTAAAVSVTTDTAPIDSNGNGVPNAVETRFETSQGTAAGNDTADVLKQRIYRPQP